MNLRPSGYEPDELPGCSIPRHFPHGFWWCEAVHRKRDTSVQGFTRFGDDLLSHVLRRSTIGATALNCRVRDGTGCFARAMITKPRKTLDCPSQHTEVRMTDVFEAHSAFAVCLLLDQIKPIEQLVPVN